MTTNVNATDSKISTSASTAKKPLPPPPPRTTAESKSSSSTAASGTTKSQSGGGGGGSGKGKASKDGSKTLSQKQHQTADKPPPSPPPSFSSLGPIADPVVVEAVHNLLAMLQTYGPLTYAQLEFNLPTMNPPNKLKQILDVLLVTGVVNLLRETPRSGDEGKEDVVETEPEATSEAAAAKTDNTGSPPPASVDRYCFLRGDTFRGVGDTVRVPDVLPALEAARREITESEERIAILREKLRADDGRTRTSARDALQAMERRWPSLADDPVYATALKNSCRSNA